MQPIYGVVKSGILVAMTMNIAILCNVTPCKLHGYNVQQQYPTIYFPTDAHNIKKCKVIKTF